jgi:hypothetical protein
VNHRRNTCGQAYALTVMTPIIDGREPALAQRLNEFEDAAGSPLAAVGGTHFARWVVISDVIREGASQPAEHLAQGRLLFTSNFDGPLDPYLERLRTGLGKAADEIWSHCVGFPGTADMAAFASYMRAHQLQTALFFGAYGGLTVEQVRRSLATRRQLIDFSLRAQRMAPAELKASFQETFAR